MNWLRIVSYIVLTLLIVPIAVILYEGFGPMNTPSGYGYALYRSIELTLTGSAFAVMISVFLYTPLAYFFARNNSKISQTLSDIPASIPHPIIGIALLILASPITPLGQFFLRNGFDLFNTLLGYVIVLVIVSAPIYIKAMQPFFESMNRAHENYAAGLGAGQLRIFISVVLPNSGRGLLSASLIALSRAISEYGSLAIIAYIILQPTFQGVSPSAVYIVNEYIAGNLKAAVTSSAILILISVPIMAAFRYLQRPLSRM
jgi:molybdate/tungstate transport system permease protein